MFVLSFLRNCVEFNQLFQELCRSFASGLRSLLECSQGFED